MLGHFCDLTSSTKEWRLREEQKVDDWVRIDGH